MKSNRLIICVVVVVLLCMILCYQAHAYKYYEEEEDDIMDDMGDFDEDAITLFAQREIENALGEEEEDDTEVQFLTDQQLQNLRCALCKTKCFFTLPAYKEDCYSSATCAACYGKSKFKAINVGTPVAPPATPPATPPAKPPTTPPAKPPMPNEPEPEEPLPKKKKVTKKKEQPEQPAEEPTE